MHATVIVALANVVGNGRAFHLRYTTVGEASLVNHVTKFPHIMDYLFGLLIYDRY